MGKGIMDTAWCEALKRNGRTETPLKRVTLFAGSSGKYSDQSLIEKGDYHGTVFG